MNGQMKMAISVLFMVRNGEVGKLLMEEQSIRLHKLLIK